MLRTHLVCGVLASCLLPVGFLAAQAPAPQQRGEGRADGQVRVHRSSMLIGGAVSLKAGDRLGKIEDFVIDEGGCISMLVVTYGDYYLAVPWSVAEFDFSQRTLVLDIERARLKEIPTFTDFKVIGTADSAVA